MRKIALGIFLLMTFTASAAQQKPLVLVSTDAIATEAQITPEGTSNDNVALVWWVPNEFWGALFAQDQRASKEESEQFLNALEGTSLFAVVQADIGMFGSFDFYSKTDVENNMKISFVKESGETQPITPLQDIDEDLKLFLSMFKPMLQAAMGNLGENFHFYVLPDINENGTRLIDPYKKGTLKFTLKDSKNKALTGGINLPLDSLFIPRKCENGKNAHISWDYCPWSGKKIKE